MNRLIIFIVIGFSTMGCFGQKAVIVNAANRFIKSLEKDQQVKALFPFEDEERYTYHFVPRDDRKGISMNELTPSQKAAAMTLLKACFSQEGYRKTTEIMQNEVILKAIEKRADTDRYRDPGKYFISIFGIPGQQTIWGWRLEGHHVAFNFSSNGNKLVAATPGFMGSNPAVVQDGPQKGKELLKEETANGFALLNSFTKEQLNEAIIDNTAPAEIFTFDSRKAMISNAGGIKWSSMTSVQQQHLLKLIEVYVRRYTKLFADEMMKEIQSAGLENLRFSWAGAREPGLGHPHYYRVQGPTFIIEYDNTQNNANHVHSVLRDLQHDFGGDELMEHYKAAH